MNMFEGMGDLSCGSDEMAEGGRSQSHCGDLIVKLIAPFGVAKI